MASKEKKIPFIYQKFLDMVNARTEDGTCPNTRLEENMARDFRLCRQDVKRIFTELKIGESIEEDYRQVTKKKNQNAARRGSDYSRNGEDYLQEMRQYRPQ
jgi:hypothetical protein